MAQSEQHASRTDPQQDQGCPALWSGIAKQLHGAHQAHHSNRCRKEAGKVKGTSLRFADIGNNSQRQRDGDQSQRNINKENPVPAGIAGNKATQRWTDDRRNQRRPCQCGNGFDELIFWRGTQYRQAADGHHQRATNTLKDSHGDKGVHVAGKAAKNGGKRKNGQRQREDLTRAEAIGNPAAGRDQYRQRNQVGADTDIEVNRRNAKIFCHVRQRGSDYRPVKKLHEKCAGDQQRRSREGTAFS